MKPTLATLLIAVLTLAATSQAQAAPTISELFGFPCGYSTGCPDGSAPNSLIQASDGHFYGTTPDQVFKITPAGQFTLLFTSPYNPSGTEHYPGGTYAKSPVEGTDGFLYAVASSVDRPRASPSPSREPCSRSASREPASRFCTRFARPPAVPMAPGRTV